MMEFTLRFCVEGYRWEQVISTFDKEHAIFIGNRMAHALRAELESVS